MAFVVLSVIAVTASVMMRSSGRNAYKVEFTEDNKIGVRIDNVHYSSNRNGRVEWTLEAASAVRMKDGDTAILDEVDMVFYAKDGMSYRLKAKKARLMESEGVVEAEGDVTVSTSSGVGLKTKKIKHSVQTPRETTNERLELR
ncbi:MAG: LPS export ABC transporter periplasmic protein LptC, partial [Deltaproteobacteria bacterium]|nr:LPS export ABC transporter periplasmic protein LptC [Deltaproteobacteria bacterium]